MCNYVKLTPFLKCLLYVKEKCNLACTDYNCIYSENLARLRANYI